MDAPIIAALIAALGVIVGLFCRDIVMALFLAGQKREQEVKDRIESLARERHDVVRLYADPLREAATSLGFRLREIIDKKEARYLLADTPKTTFDEYKWISTVYRLAALLGWIRAFRRERSYLDPGDVASPGLMVEPISTIEQALADGQHVEEQRLDELLDLWKIPQNARPDVASRPQLAAAIDATRREFLSAKTVLSATDLDADDKLELARLCAHLVSESTKVELPESFVSAWAEQASVSFGIKEAYIYRDWQAALGDLMIIEISDGPRRFDVIGFGKFEERYLLSRAEDSVDRRWFDRLDALFHDLDMTKVSAFDARRQQIQNLQKGCTALVEFLAHKVSALQKATSVG